MSSTSKEVCELWNGQRVIRTVGEAPIAEFICLFPTAKPTSERSDRTAGTSQQDPRNTKSMTGGNPNAQPVRQPQSLRLGHHSGSPDSASSSTKSCISPPYAPSFRTGKSSRTRDSDLKSHIIGGGYHLNSASLWSRLYGQHSSPEDDELGDHIPVKSFNLRPPRHCPWSVRSRGFIDGRQGGNSTIGISKWIAGMPDDSFEFLDLRAVVAKGYMKKSE